MKFTYLVMSVLLLAPSGTAQTSGSPAFAAQRKQHESTGQPAKTAADFSQEPVLYEYVRGTMRYENDGSGVREVRARVRVQTGAGLAKAGQLLFDYNASDEKIEIRVRVIKPDGSVSDAGPDAIQDLSAPVAREAPIYTDARQKHVTVPGVSVGDVVEYDVVTKSVPLLAGEFWQTWNFLTNAICLDEQLDLNIPGNRLLKIKSPPETEPSVRSDGDRRIYHWATATLEYPEVANPMGKMKFDVKTMLEGVQPSEPRQVLFSTFRSWDAVGRWYAELEHDRRAVTPEIRAKADEIVKGQTTQPAKAQALYSWVSRNIRYVSLSFGVGRYQPHSAGEVLQNRYGDCKDKTTLLEAFLEAEGLHGDAVLINSKHKIDPDVPSPLQFDHAFTFVTIDGHDAWLDSTLGVGPFRYLLPQLRGKDALVVATNGTPSIRKTPDELPDPTMYKVSVESAVDEAGKVDAKFGLDTRGDLEVLVRMMTMQLPPNQVTGIMERAAAQVRKTGAASLSFSDYKTSDPSDATKPFHMEIRIQSQLAKPHLAIGDESPQEAARALTGAIAGHDVLLSFLPGVEFDRPAVRLGGPKEYSLEIAVTLPDLKSDSSSAPVRLHISKDFAEYESESAWEGKTARVSWHLNLRVPEVPASESKEYAAFCQQVVESLGTSSHARADSKLPANSADSTSTPKKAVAPPPEHVAGYTAFTFYKQGEDAAKRQDWANAEQAFQSAVKEDPDYDRAWRDLGRAQMSMLKYAEAESAFRKYLELAPEEPRAYGNLAWALTADKKYSDVVELLEKRVAAHPDDGDAYQRLGYAHVLLRQPEHAIPELEKAAALLPKYRPAHFALAQAYLQNHENDKAAASFQRAIEVDGSNATLNSAAYALAEAQTHLEIAESWSIRSIQAVELELNETTLPIQHRAMLHAGSLAAFWDTLGWIKFQKGDLAGAENYLRAAVELASDTTMTMHLGRICEKQGRTNEAIDAYAETIASVPTTREMDDDEKQALKGLSVLLKDDSLVQERVKQSRTKMKERASVSIPNSASIEGIAQYMLIIGPDSHATAMESMDSEDSLTALSAVRKVRLPQSFPDDMLQKLPRSGTLSCPRADSPCTLTLASAGAAIRTLPGPSQSNAQ
jgi:Flp pilus assembly protein TadD